MSARRTHTLVSVIVLLALLSQPFAAQATPQSRTSHQPVRAADQPGSGFLFRTSVTLDGARTLARLAKLGVVVLEATADGRPQTAAESTAAVSGPLSAVVLATADQLEALARLGFQPRASDALVGLATSASAQGQAWLSAGLRPLLAQAAAVQQERAQAQAAGALFAADAPAVTALHAALHALSPEQMAGIAALPSDDFDGDGLTDTEEAWWCTDPEDPDTDADGRSDGSEIQTLQDWLGNRRAGPPFETPWPSWPFNDTTCPDKDHDSIPNLAERWELGLNMDLETSDHDKFDDGQELFGVTYCPGGDLSCGYGDLPRSSDSGFVGAAMPSWVKAPGNHPLVAAFPVPEVDVVESSLHVQTVTTVTTDHVIASGTEKSYSTAKTEGSSTGVANTTTWNEWEEVAETRAIQSQAGIAGLPGNNHAAPREYVYRNGLYVPGSYATQIGPTAPSTSGLASGLGLAQGIVSALELPIKVAEIGKTYGEAINRATYIGARYYYTQKAGEPLVWPAEYNEEYDKLQAQSEMQKYCPGGCSMKLADTQNGLAMQRSDISNQQYINSGVGNYVSRSELQTTIERLYEATLALRQPVPTRTETKGTSWGGAQTTTTEEYEEHTITNGEVFSDEESWGNATAVNSAHAADLWFSYQVQNTGTDYALNIKDVMFNIYIGDRDTPACTYWLGAATCGTSAGSLTFPPLEPGESHPGTSARLPITLDQMKAVDLGGPVRIVMEDFSYGSDEQYYKDAAGAGVLLAMEDGTADGDEAIDTYLIPTWGEETVLDVLGRYFPHTTDANGMMTAVWTPEYRADTPSWCAEPQVVGLGSQRTLWCKHALSTADWWNIYTNGMGDGSEGFQDTPAAPGQTALFRFNSDSDLDGYSDRSELRLGTDPQDPTSHPKPELLAGMHSIRSGNYVTATLSLLNTGIYDAYGVEAVMIAPNDTVSITNNTVGGSGRVRAQKQVIVGSRIATQTPLPAAWLTAGHAQPAAGGYYTGPTDLTYAFTAADSGSVGAGTLRLNWSDGVGGGGTLNFGAGYQSPTLLDVSRGVKLGLLSGALNTGESFTVVATAPRDTFQYTIAAGHESDFTPPLVLVSYNDPQGNHRFAIPQAAMSLSLPTDNLMAFSDQMLQEPGVEIATTAAATTGANTTSLVVNNSTGATLSNAHLFLEFVDITGTVVSEVPTTANLPPGPNVIPVNWDTASFSPAHDSAQDYIVMAFLTDYQGNILDTAARPLSSFQEDPQPAFAMRDEDAAWDFGTATQGTLLKRSFTFANTGALDLLTYVSAPAGLTVSQTGSRTVGMADMTTYAMTLNTANLGVGPYTGDITIRTSDPDAREQTVRVTGTVTAAPAEMPVGAMQRPLDWPATVSGTQGQWAEFTHTLGPEPQTLHPVKVWSQDYSALKGVGKYATPFGAGTASYDMFGDGHHGDRVVNTTETFAASMTRFASTAPAGQYIVYFESSTAFNPGDEVLLIQIQGSGAGAYEFARIVARSGQQNTLQNPLRNTYTQDGTSKAQAVFVHQFRNVTVTSGAQWVAPAWNGSEGGIIVFRANGTVTVDGSIDANGNRILAPGSGTSGFPAGGIGGGFTGGRADAANNDGYGQAQQGEGYPGAGGYTYNSNGNGGGSGGYTHPYGVGAGGGGGNGAAGANGGNGGGSSYAGLGGSSFGIPELTIMGFGGGGGGGSKEPTYTSGGGGSGGGIIFISGASVAINSSTGLVTANGGSGASADGPGGGGAGGSILVRSRSAVLGTNRIQAVGGVGGNGQVPGGTGGVGRIRVEYCETPPAFSTSPAASPQKLNCYIAEQVESAPYNRGRLNLPESGDHTYQVQYGRTLNFSGSGVITPTLRVPAGIFTSVTLQALVSDLPSNAAFSLDVGNTGTPSWNGTVGNGGEYTSPNLAAYFNAYWASHGAPITGTLDVPMRVTLDRSGQVLLTNLQVTPAGSKTRSLRLPVLSQGYSSVTANLTVSGGTGPLAVGVDVGDDGSIDWTYTGSPAYPASLTVQGTAFTAAINAYLAAVGGQSAVDVPLRIYLAPFATLELTGLSATPAGETDAGIGASDIAFSSATPVETDTITIDATLHNPGSLDSGPLTAAFYALRTTQYADYIGSAFVGNVAALGTATVPLQWNTTGFTGAVPVRVVIDPYNRVAEADETNNVVTATVTIRTRPDLSIASITPADPEPVAGQPVTVTLTVSNTGQTTAGASTLALYDGHPDAGGALICETALSVPGEDQATPACAWTPTTPGAHRLFARADRDGQVNESDKGNNDRWLDVYVGFGAPIALDSGASGADPVYTNTLGYGAVDTGLPDATVTCAGRSDPTLRRDPSNRVGYRFDHLQPGRAYHLDIVLYECDNNQRVERVLVDDLLVAGPIALGDQAEHRLSLRLDPAAYRDHTVDVAVVGEEGSQRAAVVASVALREIDYRYADSGSGASGAGADLAYTPERGWGYLDGDAFPGDRPFKSARVDQTDNDVSYRFDRLDPAKRYQLHFTFWQATGNPLLQRIRADGLDSGATIDLVAGTAISKTLRLAPATYAADGSAVVSVVVLNASTSATVNEIALEEETLLTESPCRGVQETPSLSRAMGGLTVDGLAGPVGTVVTAESPLGEIVGCYVVGTDGSPAGQYGFMPIYGEDASASPPIPGMRAGELVTFRVDGALAQAAPPFYWHNDLSEHWTDLVAAPLEGQSILLPQTWNLLSLRVEPPMPLLVTSLSSIAGKYDRILGENGIYDADIPAQFQTLTEVHGGRGYYLRLDGAASANLVAEGTPLATALPLALHQGWNWVGYLPQTTLPVTTALASISGAYQRVQSLNQFYDVRYPTFSTLKQLTPGQGYLIYATAPATLTYPAATAASGLPDPAQPLTATEACSVTATPALTLLFGTLTLAGAPAPLGTRVEALTPRGEVAGCYIVDRPGQYGFMPLYGADEGAQPPIPGFRAAEAVRLRVNGGSIMTAELSWQDDRTPHVLDIAAADVQRRWLPTVLH